MWSSLLFLISVLGVIPILPAYSQTVAWDQPQYRIGEFGIVVLEDNKTNQNPALIDLAFVWVYSDTDPTGLQLLVIETGSNTGIFKSDIDFGNSTNESTLKVSSGDSIFVKYDTVEDVAKIEGIAPFFTVKVDEPSYLQGDSIKIEGSISSTTYNPNLLVVVTILDPVGNVVFTSQKYPTNEGNFAAFVTADGPSWKRVGDYTVLAQYGSSIAEISFGYLGGKGGTDVDKQPYEEHHVPWGLVANTVSSSQIELAWNPPTETFGLDIVGYNINEKIGTGMYEEITTIGDNTSYLVSGLERGKTYTFVIQARYSTGVSETSKEISATTLDTIIQDPNIEPTMPNDATIPEWIRNNAKWWAEGAIGDIDFISGIQYLIGEGIMQIPDTSKIESNGKSQNIPIWIKNNADWWSKGLISDDEFVKGIQYLITQGIIIV